MRLLNDNPSHFPFMNNYLRQPAQGLTLIEILLAIAIIGVISTAVFTVAKSTRNKASDTRIRNGVNNLRWLAELTYDNQGGSFLNWSSHPDIQNDLNIVLGKIDEAYGDNNVTTIRDGEVQNYCVSAPLKSESGKHYCIDGNAVFKTVSEQCPDTSPLQCPAS